MERDFRHEAQTTRMQKQMFMVFREYRRHFEEQKTRTEAKYRKVVEDAVQGRCSYQSVGIRVDHCVHT